MTQRQVAQEEQLGNNPNAPLNTHLISLIIPVYNTEKYVAECLDSVLVQSFKNWEAICVDDGSTDRSYEILTRYAEKDQRIRIIRQENKGVCAARNNAIMLAKGLYIFPLDSDDKIAPDCLDILYSIITNTRYVAVCPMGSYFGDGIDQGSHKIVLPKPTRENMYSWSNALHNSTLYPKALWEKYGGYDEAFTALGAEDYDFFLNFIDDSQACCQVPGDLFYYRIKPQNESRNMMTSRDAAIFERTKEVMFAKRPIMKLLYAVPRRGHAGDSVLKLLGIVPFMKIRRRRSKTVVLLFGFLPLLLIRYKPQQTIWRLLGFVPVLIESEGR